MSEAPEGISPMVWTVTEAMQVAGEGYCGMPMRVDVAITLARAAIEAMREPTKKMIRRGADQCDGSEFAAEDTWETMIDTALAEPTATR